MTTRIDDLVGSILEVWDSADGRPLTRNQSERLAGYQQDLAAAVDEAPGSPYARSLLREATQSPDDPRALREYRTQVRREELAAMVPGSRVPVVEASPFADPADVAAVQRAVSRSYGVPAVVHGLGERSELMERIRQFRQDGHAPDLVFQPSESMTTRSFQSLGGSAVPSTFYERVTVYQRTATPMLDPGVVTIDSVATGQAVTLPRLTADAATGGTVTAEGAGIVQNDATISAVTVKPFKYAHIDKWTAELDADNAIGIQQLLAQSTGRALSLDIGTATTTGAGTTEPFGFITRATNGGTASMGTAIPGGDSFFGWADWVDLYMSVPAPVRSVGVFQVSTTALKKALKWRTTTGEPILRALTAGGPLTFQGRPVYENPAMAAVGSASKSVAFGDFSQYHVVKVDLRIEFSRDAYFGTDHVALKIVERVDGDLVDTSAVNYLVSANT